MHFSSSKDKNLVMASMLLWFNWRHLGDYTSFRVFVFICKWVECNCGVGTDDLGFTLVDLEKFNYIEESFIMAFQAK